MPNKTISLSEAMSVQARYDVAARGWGYTEECGYDAAQIDAAKEFYDSAYRDMEHLLTRLTAKDA